MAEDTGITEATEATEATEEGDAAPQVSQTGEAQAAAGQDEFLKEVRGLKQGLVEERRKRQERDGTIDALQREIAELKKGASGETMSDEDYIQLKHVKAMLAEEKKKEQEGSFKSEYESTLREVQGKDDYQEMIAFAEELLSSPKYAHEYKGVLDVVLHSVDGPRIAYNLGKLHPDYAKRLTAGERKKAADTIAKNLNKTQTLTGVQGSADSTIDLVKHYRGMSDAEFEEEKAKRMGL